MFHAGQIGDLRSPTPGGVNAHFTKRSLNWISRNRDLPGHLLSPTRLKKSKYIYPIEGTTRTAYHPYVVIEAGAQHSQLNSLPDDDIDVKRDLMLSCRLLKFGVSSLRSAGGSTCSCSCASHHTQVQGNWIGVPYS